ncbi:MAG: hypothetical protein HWD86_10870 [Kangiellaceae bacterium]|nr:hypothetical protein [Kangiellaceae bacterium]
MKEYYCWRCDSIVPMLEEHEWIKIEPLLRQQMLDIKDYRERTGCDIREGIEKAEKPATSMYYELTGYLENNVAAIYHHRLIDFGPECNNCGYLLRTPKAKFCANCGNRE